MSSPLRPADGQPDSDGARWAAHEALLQDVLAQPLDQRGAYLEQVCPDPKARAEVVELLAAHARRGVLDELVEEVMTPLLASHGAMPDPAPITLPPHSPYRILERLGGGGMGIVFRAHDERLARDVALKFLPSHLSADISAKKRFLVEARAAAAIEHPNICTVHEIGETEDGHLYIVMACYEGETLDVRIARGPLAVDDALRVAIEIARGLVKAHERGIIHRDIKPANVMITGDGQLKILDFGIAKLADMTVTTTAGAIGTVAYMSPEQAFGETVDHRTDIWSLGVVLYEMLAGVRPFQGPGEHAVLVAALSAEPEPIMVRRAEVTAELDAVIRRTLAKRPADRFANAGDLLASLTACMSGASGSVSGGVEPRQADTSLTRGGERRQVTVVACTLDGQDALVERLSPEAADRVLTRIRDQATEEATRHGGVVNVLTSDGFVMLFGVPTAHEDDALRGVQAAMAMHARVRELALALDGRLSTALRLRTGIHAGPVVALRLRTGDQRFRITGGAADVAARLGAAADSDTILVSPETRRLVAPFVHTSVAQPVAVHGAGPPLVPYRVEGASAARSRLDSAARDELTPLVGRERERAALAEHLAQARGGNGRVTVLVGEAGAGKSRLLHDLRETATASGMRVLTGRCDAYGRTTPFLPFSEAVQEALGVPVSGTPPERHAAVVAATRAIDASLEEYLPLYLTLLALPSEAHPVPEHLRGELLQDAMLQAIAALFTLDARILPTVLLLEDWHWADDASRAAFRQLADLVPAFPLLLIATARPDYSGEWGSADHQTLIHLAPIDQAAAAAIASAVLGAERIAPELVLRLHERTGGNPFFLEELCQALREDGAVTLRAGEAVAADESGPVQVPDTVQGVLRTRIDRLEPEARDTLRVAAVIGREFTRGVLEDVLGAGGSLLPAVELLKASGLVQQVSVMPEPVYRFKHALAQEVAYDSLLEHQRASLHQAVGRSMERRYAARLDEYVERLAHHFSRAEAWSEAVTYGLLAADRATDLSQNLDALGTLERVEGWVQRLPEDAQRRDRHADVLFREERLCEMLGLRHRQLELIELLIGLLAPHGPSKRLAEVYLRQGDAFTLRRRFEAAERALETALQIARERTDQAGERNAMRSIALLRSHEGRHQEAREIIEEVLRLGEAAGERRAEAGDLATLANILRDLGEPTRALQVLEAALTRTAAADNPIRYGALLSVIGTVYRDLGEFETALEYFRRVTAQGLEQRHPVNASFTLPAIAHIQLEQGKVDEALATYREALDLSRRARHAEGSAHASRSLGEVLAGLGRHEEALPLLRDAAALFAQLEDRPTEALMWRRVATVHERLGAHQEASVAWLEVRRLTHALTDVAGEAEAIEGVARAERHVPGLRDASVARYEEALALAAGHGDHKRELAVHNSLGIVHWQRGSYVDALRHYEAALRLCREHDDGVHEGLILNSLGATLHKLRRWDEARIALGEAVRVTEASGEQLLRAHALSALGDVCLASGRLAEAQASFEASLGLRGILDDRRGEAWMLERLARLHAARGAPAASSKAATCASRIALELADDALLAAVALLQTDSVAPDSLHP